MRIAIRVVETSLLVAAVATSAQAQDAPNVNAASASHAEVGRIRGTVFDSLLMRPVAHATVMLMSGARSVTTDNKGNFSIDDVATGSQSVAFSSPEIDSIGLGTLGASVVVTARGTATVTVSTPSLRTLWTYRCDEGNRVGSDSGIVWGTIRDAATNGVASAAVATFEWNDLKVDATSGIRMDKVSRQVRTTDLGFYFACGLPIGPAIASDARSEKSASGAVQYAIGARKLQRLDLMVSTDMVAADGAPKSAADSAAMLRARGKSTMRGTVIDARKRPLPNAMVSIANIDTSVVTDNLGRFQLGMLPAGTQVAQSKKLGLPPVSQVVQLRADTSTDVTIEMSGVNTLSAMNIRAKGADRVEFEERRKMKLGFAMDMETITKRSDMYSTMSSIPGAIVTHKEGGAKVLLGVGRNQCTPTVMLDGLPVPIESVTAMPPSNFYAIEVFPHKSDVPPEYAPGQQINCLILFWSKNARW